LALVPWDKKLIPKSWVIGAPLFGDDAWIVEGRGTLVIGYPLGLGVEQDKNHPVIRLGMIAQKPEGKTFLLDAMASHGNSGSPVFVLTEVGTKLVGMITAHRADAISLLTENGQLAASLPYNSGLASAIKATVILEDIHCLTNLPKMPSKQP
jgi:S1-C subfamily serine protease